MAASASTPIRRVEDPSEKFTEEEIRAERRNLRRLDMDKLAQVNPELHASILRGFADIEAGKGIDGEEAMRQAWPDLYP